MAEGERAISELTKESPVPAAPRAPLRPAPAAEGTVVEERPEFKVLLFRRAQRVVLMVQPRREGQLAAAAVFLPEAPESSRPFKPQGAGLEFDLGPEERLRQVTAGWW